MVFQQSPEAWSPAAGPISVPSFDTRQGFDMRRAMTGGLALEGMGAVFRPQPMGLDTLPVPRGLIPVGRRLAQTSLEGVLGDPTPGGLVQGQEGFCTTGSPDSTLSTRPHRAPEGVLMADARGQREQRRINAERLRQGLPPIGNSTSSDEASSRRRTRGDESESRGRTSRDDMRSGAATRTDDGARGRRTRDDQSKSERRRVEDAGNDVARHKIVSWDRWGRPLDANGKRIKDA